MPDISKGHWPKVAIGGLVLVNAVLLTLLVLDERSRSLAVEAVPAVEPSATRPFPTARGTLGTAGPTSTNPKPTTSSASATPTSTSPKPSSTVSPGKGQAPVDRLLAVNSATLAWRAVTGPCPTDPEVEVTRDGGRTWRPSDSGLRSISRMRGYDETSVFAVGGGDKCKARYAATGGPGESWVVNPRFLGQTWYRLPNDQSQIHAPGGRLSSPCDDRLSEFAGLGTAGAAAICDDGTLRLTQDRGRNWRELNGVAKARAISADEEVYVLALPEPGCSGIGVTLLSPGAREVSPDSVRCAPTGGKSDIDLAVAVRGQVVWLWAGDEVVVSTDRGRNWKRP